MKFLIPIVSALLFRAGGMDQWQWAKIPFTKIFISQKLWRWFMGAVIGLLLWKGLVAYAITIACYFIATNLFGYGDKTPILKYLPQNIKHLMSGVMFGLASFPLIGWWCLAQAAISGAMFYLVETRKINNPYAEFLRGGVGTCLLVFF